MKILIGYDGSESADAAIATAAMLLVHRTPSHPRVSDLGRERLTATRIRTGNRA